jgi:tetratricopeptide (TPR) repeat protein
MKHRPILAAILVSAAVILPLLTARAQDQTGTAEKPAEKPVEQPAEKPADKTDTKPVEKPAAETAPPPTAPSAAAPQPVLPDAALAKTIVAVRRSPIGAEANAVTYLDMIESGKATAAQVNDFAAYVAKRGMPRVALAFQEHALRLEENDPTLWLNLGTIRRTVGSLGPAASAFKKAIAIDPVNAMAHYNLGAVYDAQKNYDEAIDEYRRALVLDPDLADPRKNPQVVNNENLLAVRLQIYHDQAGSLGLPLLQMQKTPAQPKAAPDKP